MVCKAFPNGIPFEILSSVVDHRNSYGSDGGVVYEKRANASMQTEQRVIRLIFDAT